MDEAQKDQILRELADSLFLEHKNFSNRIGSAQQLDARGRLWGSILAVAFTISALSTYLFVGDYKGEEVIGAEIILKLDPRKDIDELALWRTKLKNRVSRNPHDGDSWYLLGHTRLLLKSYKESQEAFEMAKKLMPDNLSLDIYLLQARYLAADGRLDKQAKQLANTILSVNPIEPLVLEILAIEAFKETDYLASLRYLNSALSGPLPLAQKQALQFMLREARSVIGSMEPSFNVRISVSSKSVPPDVLFVIARPVGGGMPYAVVRRHNPSFPITVTLDDSSSIDKAKALSNAEEVELVVRLSSSLQIGSDLGDWHWVSPPVDVAAASQGVFYADPSPD